MSGRTCDVHQQGLAAQIGNILVGYSLGSGMGRDDGNTMRKSPSFASFLSQSTGCVNVLVFTFSRFSGILLG